MPPTRFPRVLVPALLVALGACLGVLGRGVHRPAPPIAAGLEPSTIPGEEFQNLFASVAEAVRPAVVLVSYTKKVSMAEPEDLPPEAVEGRREMRQRSLGSGVVVDRRGFILTNHHVVGDAETLSVKLWDGRMLSARVVQKDSGADIALIKVDCPELKEIPLGNSEDLKVGHWVLAIGSPFGLTQTVSAGIVSAVGRSGLGILPYEGFIQTDAAINQGNSGGPLVDIRGRLVGINTAIFSNSSGASLGISFAVPINLASALVQKWIQGKSSNYLGIKASRIDADAARYFGMEGPRGALVELVVADSPADQGGLREKDILIRFNDVEIRDENHFRFLLAQAQAGKPTAVEVLRPRKGARPEPARLELVLTDRDLESTAGSARPAEPSPRTRMLGITVVPLSDEVARDLSLPEATPGVAVIDVEPNSPADSKGVREGDIIVEVNERPVKDLPDLREALAAADPRAGGGAEVIMIRIVRNGENIGYKFLPRGEHGE